MLSKRGQALVELGILFPVFLTILCGFFEWGMFFFCKITLDSSAYNACRLATTYRSWPTMQTTYETNVRSEFMAKANYLPQSMIPNISGQISIAYTPLIAAINTITVSTPNMTYNSLFGFGRVFGIPNIIRTSVTLSYEF